MLFTSVFARHTTTTLHEAVWANKLQDVWWLLQDEHGLSQVDCNALGEAGYWKRVRILQMLVFVPGVDLNNQLMNSTGRCEYMDVIRILLRAPGFNVNHKSTGRFDDGMTALHVATLRNDVQLVRMLLAAGADKHQLTDSGSHALWFAASRRGDAVIRMLLEGCTEDPATMFLRGLQWGRALR